MTRERIDKLLVERGLFTTRARAQAAIEAGGVRADGRLVDKPGQKVARDAAIDAEPAHPWVSRAGIKLDHAIRHFGIAFDGSEVVDIGASTGGFTQVALHHGARHVNAVDVGHGQLDPELSGDKRVTVLERMDARNLTADHLPAAPDRVVCDVSFIGLEKALGPALALASHDAILIGLFKPQFQVGRAHIGKGGIVKDEAAIAIAKDRFIKWLQANAGFALTGWTQSPIAGSDGNTEFVFCAHRARATA